MNVADKFLPQTLKHRMETGRLDSPYGSTKQERLYGIENGARIRFGHTFKFKGSQHLE